MGLQVLRPYIFLGLVKEIDDWRKVVEEANSRGCGISVYVNPDVKIILVQHDSHLESILSLTSSLDEKYDFQATYFGCEVKIETSECTEPSPLNLMFVPLQHESSLFEEYLGDLFWRVFRMFGKNWIFAYSNEKAQEQRPIFEILRESSARQILGLSRVAKYRKKSVRKKKRKYDPLKARIRELKYQLLHAQSHVGGELANLRYTIKLENLQRDPYIFNHRFQLIRQLLEKESEKIGKTLKVLEANFASIENTVAVLNEFESVIGILKSTHYIPRIRYQMDRQLLESDEIFNVEDAFGFDAYTALGLKGSCPIVIPGKGYRCRVTRIVNNTRVIELPLSIGLRLGLLPILYHVVSHVLVEETAENLPVGLKTLARELEKISGGYIERKKTALKNAEGRALLITQELVADLIAARIAGPAYFYALLRAFPFEPKSGGDHYVRLQDRLSVLRVFLQDRGFTLRLRGLPTNFWNMDLVEDDFTLNLFRLVSGLKLPLAYSLGVHESMLEDVKPGLMLGRVSPVKPSLVSNALWDAVVERKGYLNENAAFLSVLEWLESTEIYEMSW